MPELSGLKPSPLQEDGAWVYWPFGGLWVCIRGDDSQAATEAVAAASLEHQKTGNPMLLGKDAAKIMEDGQSRGLVANWGAAANGCTDVDGEPITDAEDLTEGGEPVPCTPENVRRLWEQAPQFRKFVLKWAQMISGLRATFRPGRDPGAN